MTTLSPAPLQRTFFALASLSSLILLSGCSLGLGDRSGSGTVQILSETPSPREIVVETGMSPPAACVVDVNSPPPTPKTEVAPKRPNDQAVWQEGNWRYYGARFVWLPGHWAMPPRPHAVYTQPRWDVVNGNHMFTEGYWHF